MTLMRLGLVVLLLLFCSVSTAQELAEPDAASAILAQDPDWSALARRGEATVESGVGSTFALERLRSDLFDWRDRFLDQQGVNTQRIATVSSQIEALGPVPETGDEPQEIAQRREELLAERARLQVPRALAAEAYARANGLILEIDSIIRAKEADQLAMRGPSPLNPVHWSEGLTAVAIGLGNVLGAVIGRLESTSVVARLWSQLPLALIYFGAALLLLLRGRIVVGYVQNWTESFKQQWRAISSFLLSLVRVGTQTAGIWALLRGVDLIGLLALPGVDLSSTFFSAAMVVIISRWLNSQLFPSGPGNGPLRYDAATRGAIRRTGTTLGGGLAAIIILTAVLQMGDPTDLAVEVALFPAQVIVAYLLFSLGRLLRRAPVDADLPGSSGGRLRRFVGRIATLVAVAAPALAALGYGPAAAWLLGPFILTLAILGVVIILQGVAADIFAPTTRTEGDAGPLWPVLIAFVLVGLALPVLALVWGARVADLIEIWARFREGFAIGASRITPADVLTFVVIFSLGYLITQSIKGVLRRTVLPRTRLDRGGQNAVVAGFGYVGIFIAALVAINGAGIDLSNLAIVAGALSVGIGFGLQNIVQNFVSGIILLIERPIGEGDMIEVNGNVGFVRNISVRSTIIETFDRTDVIIPNADLVSGQVTNWTRGNAVGRLILPVGVAYGSDVALVKSILMEVAEAQAMVLADPPPQVLFVNFGASSLDFEIRVILRDVNWKMLVTSDMNEEINRRFTAAGIEIPFAQRDVWLRNPEALSPKEGTGDA